MPKYKTIDVQEVIEMVNRLNRESTCSPDMRKGWNELMNDILNSCNVNAGFGYLSVEHVPAGQAPDIRIYPDAPTVFPDESRRTYYVHRYLAKEPKKSAPS